MVIVRCKACGAVYNYNKEGCCPRCGAYNRPPKRERVMADGTVQHMTDTAYAKKQSYSDKVCFEQKECHEEKECYEHQAQQGYRTPSAAGAPDGNAPSFAAPRVRQTRKRGCFPLVGILIAASVLFSVLSGLLDDGFESDETDHPAEGLFSVDLDDWERDDYWLEAEMGDPFTLPDGTVMAIASVAWSDADQSYRLYMVVEGGVVPDACTLYLRDRRGENLYAAMEYEVLSPYEYSFPVGMDGTEPDHVILNTNAPDGRVRLICVHLEW